MPRLCRRPGCRHCRQYPHSPPPPCRPGHRFPSRRHLHRCRGCRPCPGCRHSFRRCRRSCPHCRRPALGPVHRPRPCPARRRNLAWRRRPANLADPRNPCCPRSRQPLGTLTNRSNRSRPANPRSFACQANLQLPIGLPAGRPAFRFLRAGSTCCRRGWRRRPVPRWRRCRGRHRASLPTTGCGSTWTRCFRSAGSAIPAVAACRPARGRPARPRTRWTRPNRCCPRPGSATRTAKTTWSPSCRSMATPPVAASPTRRPRTVMTGTTTTSRPTTVTAFRSASSWNSSSCNRQA